MKINNMTLWQEADGYKIDDDDDGPFAKEENVLDIYFLEDFLVLRTKRFCVGLDELKRLQKILKDQLRKVNGLGTISDD